MKFTPAPALALLFFSAFTAAETGLACPYINSACTLKPPVQNECRSFEFGVCSRAPSNFTNWHYITTLVNNTNVVFKRYNSTNCSENTAESQWNVQGPLGACLGPVDRKLGIDAYVSIVKANATNTTTSVNSTSPSTAAQTQTQSGTTTTPGSTSSMTMTSTSPVATTTSPTQTGATTTAPTAGQTTTKAGGAGVITPGMFGVVVGVLAAMLV